jgi:hypothetical protein
MEFHNTDFPRDIIKPVKRFEEVIYASNGLEGKIFIAKYRIELLSEAKINKALRDL